jgi:hypothetical protein
MPTTRHRVPRFGADFMSPTHFAWLRGEQFDPEAHDLAIWSALELDVSWLIEPDPPRRRPYLESGIKGRRLWSLYRDEVLAEHVREHPGTRPAPWWKFDAPEPRPRGEPEAGYLQRHKLLTPGELTRLRPADFAPEAGGEDVSPE